LICSELNHFIDLKPTLITVIKHVKKLTCCEAVGIRLHDDGDYPYYVFTSFPESFIIHESSLCQKDEEGYWHQLESYIQTHTDAEFSHGICPECSKELCHDIFGKKQKNK